MPLVFDSPHSGRTYPEGFDHICDEITMKQAEDRYVDLLFEDAPLYGVSFLKALFPRTFIDVNRAENDIDKELLEDEWPLPLETSARAAAGIGLVRRMIRPGRPLYDRRLTAAEISARIEEYYRPYHRALEGLLDKAHTACGAVWHIDCHSMPSRTPKGTSYARDGKSGQPDFVIGDRNGTSCERRFTLGLMNFLQDMGYRVSLNRPYSGVEIVRRHSNPEDGRHSLQLEICKSLYLDEDTGELNGNFNSFREDINKMTEFCAEYVSAHFTRMAAD